MLTWNHRPESDQLAIINLAPLYAASPPIAVQLPTHDMSDKKAVSPLCMSHSIARPPWTLRMQLELGGRERPLQISSVVSVWISIPVVIVEHQLTGRRDRPAARRRPRHRSSRSRTPDAKPRVQYITSFGTDGGSASGGLQRGAGDSVAFRLPASEPHQAPAEAPRSAPCSTPRPRRRPPGTAGRTTLPGRLSQRTWGLPIAVGAPSPVAVGFPSPVAVGAPSSGAHI